MLEQFHKMNLKLIARSFHNMSYTRETPGFPHFSKYWEFLDRFSKVEKIIPVHLSEKYKNVTPIQTTKIAVPVRAEIVGQIRDIFSKISGTNIDIMLDDFKQVAPKLKLISSDVLTEILKLIYEYSVDLPELLIYYQQIFDILNTEAPTVLNQFYTLVMNGVKEPLVFPESGKTSRWRQNATTLYINLLTNFPHYSTLSLESGQLQSVIDHIHDVMYLGQGNTSRIDDYIHLCKYLKTFPTILSKYKEQWDVMSVDRKIPLKYRFLIQDL